MSLTVSITTSHTVIQLLALRVLLKEKRKKNREKTIIFSFMDTWTIFCNKTFPDVPPLDDASHKSMFYHDINTKQDESYGIACVSFP